MEKKTQQRDFFKSIYVSKPALAGCSYILFTTNDANIYPFHSIDDLDGQIGAGCLLTSRSNVGGSRGAIGGGALAPTCISHFGLGHLSKQSRNTFYTWATAICYPSYYTCAPPPLKITQLRPWKEGKCQL